MKKVGIVGSGAMGSGIAQVCAQAGCSVLLMDTNDANLAQAKKSMVANLNRLRDKGKLDTLEIERVLQSIQYVNNLSQLADREIVIEAIVEDLSIKKQVFSDLDKLVTPACVLATNTSSLSISSIASACVHAERVIGIHFFNPAPVMELVEVIPALQTRVDLPQRIRAWVAALGKLPVIAKDTPGFIVNRVARPYYGEAMRLLDEGIATPRFIDETMKKLGNFRMGPFELMDFIGHDVNYRVTESVFEAMYYDSRYKPSLTQKRLFEAGWFGRKSGKGFYTYTPEGTCIESEWHETMVGSPVDELDNQIFMRILCMLINEAADALYLGIATAEDLDLAMLKGVNYPNGLLRWADEIGIVQVQEIMDGLYAWYREDRYRLSPLLRKMAENGKKFFE